MFIIKYILKIEAGTEDVIPSRSEQYMIFCFFMVIFLTRIFLLNTVVVVITTTYGIWLHESDYWRGFFYSK